MDAAEIVARLAEVPAAELAWRELVAELQQLADAGQLTTDDLRLHGLADAVQLVADQLIEHAEASRRIVDGCLSVPPRPSAADIPNGF